VAPDRADQASERRRSVDPAYHFDDLDDFVRSAQVRGLEVLMIKAGNPRALVAVGETSSNGRDRRKPGFTDSVAPATLARLVARANPRLRFDAWAHHPYPYPVSQAPTQNVRYPNVTLTTLPRLERNLRLWFRRRTVTIWITEYGVQTRPGARSGGHRGPAGTLRDAGDRARPPRRRTWARDSCRRHWARHRCDRLHRARPSGLTVARRRTYITHVDARTTIIPTLIRTIAIVGA